MAKLAHIPGIFATLWTPEIAPTTAVTLGTADYGFVGLPKNMIHFTTAKGAMGIRASGVINPSPWSMRGIFGPGVYMAKIGRPWNGFMPEHAVIPILLKTPQGTVRVLPRLVYVKWGFRPVPIR
ncbi:MAG: hypothetical protein CSA09_01640 [Candidatus Contendobacter odensis]|uniref:Uncharacterized protein n=1 Tax=Candidatus Contendibacter odensensis TaxID=1400860 RepID=A0A2G6PGK8_9GAMM|nr:MAG: hypothetical protein CSA09_01640 [Candidatus Contendobacter odensis]